MDLYISQEVIAFVLCLMLAYCAPQILLLKPGEIDEARKK